MTACCVGELCGGPLWQVCLGCASRALAAWPMAPREAGDTAKVRRAPGVSAAPAPAGVLTRAPPLRQAERLAALPADLLPRVVAHIWACRPARPAAEQVRHAVSLFGVCRRVRDALRADPLSLALDFSAAPLSECQRAWLAAPVRVGRIESAAFFRPWRIASDEEERLWRGGHEAFLAQHGRSLLRLTGVPLRLVATLDPSAPPALDLSGLRLTTLGVDCAVRRADGRRELWLAPGFLPQSLAELELRGVGSDGKGVVLGMGWASHPALRPDARVPALQRISVSGKTTNMQLDGLALLQGLAAAPALSVDSGRSHLAVHARVLERMRSLHLRGAPVCLDLAVRRGQYEGLARSVCPPGLQSVTLEAAAVGRCCSGFRSTRTRCPWVIRTRRTTSRTRSAPCCARCSRGAPAALRSRWARCPGSGARCGAWRGAPGRRGARRRGRPRPRRTRARPRGRPSPTLTD